MKFKLDENLPGALAEDLRAAGHDVHTVRDEDLEGSTDDYLWQVAQEEDRFFVTLDMDFSDLRKFRPNARSGLLILRTMTEGRLRIRRFFQRLIAENDLHAWRGCLVIATEHRLRITKVAGDV